MECFQCRKKIDNELSMVHIGDGDFVHDKCKDKFEKDMNEFFDNVGKDDWYEKWINE